MKTNIKRWLDNNEAGIVACLIFIAIFCAGIWCGSTSQAGRYAESKYKIKPTYRLKVRDYNKIDTIWVYRGKQ
jgi:hypothetical protein